MTLHHNTLFVTMISQKPRNLTDFFGMACAMLEVHEIENGRWVELLQDLAQWQTLVSAESNFGFLPS
jgi:hypothetical protein